MAAIEQLSTRANNEARKLSGRPAGYRSILLSLMSGLLIMVTLTSPESLAKTKEEPSEIDRLDVLRPPTKSLSDTTANLSKAHTSEDLGRTIIDINMGKLLPNKVLENSAARFPQIFEALALANAANGDVQAAKGDFDLLLKAESYDRVTGFWTGSVLKTEARQNLQSYGAQIYAGYRISDGTFPVYEDVNFTNTLGEFKVGASFSLLRDRKIDSRRFRLRDTELAAQQANFDVLLTRVDVQQKVLNSYWRWVAAGRELDVYRSLLKIAQDREAGLKKQVARGAKSQISIVENQQNIIRRKVFFTQAERNFMVATNALSFYLRGVDGTLVSPDPKQLPTEDLLPSLDDTVVYDLAKINNVLRRRPELRNLEFAIKRAENKIAISKNNLAPKLDLKLEVSRDFGDIAEGGISRDSTDTIIGLNLSVPFQRREAKGQLSRAEEELYSLQLQQRRLKDQIEVGLKNILADLTTTLRLSKLAKDEVVQSNLMVVAERNKFNLGASDFFLVNLREERAADAQIRSIRAKLEGRIARTSYDAATISLDKLGLSSLKYKNY